MALEKREMIGAFSKDTLKSTFLVLFGNFSNEPFFLLNRFYGEGEGIGRVLQPIRSFCLVIGDYSNVLTLLHLSQNQIQMGILVYWHGHID